MNRRTIFMLLAGLVIEATSGYAQTAARRRVSLDPCPGGSGSAYVDTITPPSLERLVQISELVVVGTVVNVLPATRSNPII